MLPQTTRAILDALLAGAISDQVQVDLDKLPLLERQHILCAASDMIEELALNRLERADEIAVMLIENCCFYIAGQGPTWCAEGSQVPAVNGPSE